MSQELEAFLGPDSVYAKYPNIAATYLRLLHDNSFTDLTIKLGSETVAAHAGIVACRCEEILPLAQDEKSKKRKKHEIRLKDGAVKSSAIMMRLLEYVYTGAVDFPKLTNEEILYVNQGARNLNLARLVFLCEKWVHSRLTMDNVFHLLKASSDLKEERMKSICLQFALKHYTDFISNKNGLHILGIDLFQEVVASFNPQNIKDDGELNSFGPPDTLLDDLRKLHDSMSYYDFSVTIDEELIKMHKAILLAYSELFNPVFQSGVLENLSIKSAKCLLRFFYYAEKKIDSVSACELVEFSRKFKILSLGHLAESIIRSNITVASVTKILQIAYLPVEGKQDLAAELKSKCYPFILENFGQVNLSELKLYNPLISLDLLTFLQDNSKSGQFSVGGDFKHDDEHKKKSSNSGGKKSVPAPPPRRDNSNLPAINVPQSSDSSITSSEEEMTPKNTSKTITRKKSESGKEKKKEKEKKNKKDEKEESKKKKKDK